MTCTNCSSEETLFDMHRGDDVPFMATVVESDLTTPVNISGWSFVITMKLNYMQADSAAALRVEVPALAVNANTIAGIFEFTLPSSATKDLMVAEYYFDVEGTIDGKVTTVIAGKVNVKYDVSRGDA